jgi:thioredoxin 2
LVKLNTEQAPQISQQFAIRSIPTVVLLKQGREIARQSGVMSAPQILQWVKQAWRD